MSLCVKATLGVNLKRSERVDFITQRPFVFFGGGGVWFLCGVNDASEAPGGRCT